MRKFELKTEQQILSEFPKLPRDEEGPVFAEPWHAQIFSMTCLLHEKGHFNWTEWAETLGRVIKENENEEYYLSWLKAFEEIVAEKNILASDILEKRRAAWDRAARATPHGEPIVLGAENR